MDTEQLKNGETWQLRREDRPDELPLPRSGEEPAKEIGAREAEEVDEPERFITFVAERELEDPGDIAAAETDGVDGIVHDIMNQRRDQRRLLLVVIVVMAMFALLGLFDIIVGQAIIRVFWPDFQGVSDEVVKALVAGVFAEILGVILSVAVALWKDKDYLEFLSRH